MNKKELVRTISQELDPPLSQDKISLILDKAVEIVKRTLADGKSAKWSGFDSFIVKDILPHWFYFTKRKEFVVSKGIREIIFVPPRRK